MMSDAETSAPNTYGLYVGAFQDDVLGAVKALAGRGAGQLYAVKNGGRYPSPFDFLFALHLTEWMMVLEHMDAVAAALPKDCALWLTPGAPANFDLYAEVAECNRCCALSVRVIPKVETIDVPPTALLAWRYIACANKGCFNNLLRGI